MPPGKTKDSQRRRYHIRNDLPRLRKLRRSLENLSRKVSSGKHPSQILSQNWRHLRFLLISASTLNLFRESSLFSCSCSPRSLESVYPLPLSLLFCSVLFYFLTPASY